MFSPARESLDRLVQTAAEQTTLEGIASMLQVISEELDAWGAVIWMASPGSDVVAGTGRLFVLGFWVTDPTIPVWHELTFQSLAGWVLQHGKPSQATLGDARVASPTPRFITQSETRQFGLAPMKMADGSPAVLELYRRGDQVFTDEEMGLIDLMSALLPALYATLTDRVGFELQDKISEIRRKADLDFDNPDHQDPSAARAAVQEMIDVIYETFRCLEVSIFLQDLEDDPAVFPLYCYKVAWEGTWVDKASYKRGEGATGWVLENEKPVRIVDLGRYEEDEKWIQDTYPGLKWTNSLRIHERARDHFKVNDPESSPPVSFVCAPLRSGNRVYGAIRCCGSRRNPFYFDRWHQRILEAVAARIGAWWRSRCI